MKNRQPIKNESSSRFHWVSLSFLAHSKARLLSSRAICKYAVVVMVLKSRGVKKGKNEPSAGGEKIGLREETQEFINVINLQKERHQLPKDLTIISNDRLNYLSFWKYNGKRLPSRKSIHCRTGGQTWLITTALFISYYAEYKTKVIRTLNWWK